LLKEEENRRLEEEEKYEGQRNICREKKQFQNVRGKKITKGVRIRVEKTWVDLAGSVAATFED